MGDPTDKVPRQTPGQFHVDANCIDCDVCRETTPGTFTANEDHGFSLVFKRLENDDDIEPVAGGISR